MKIAIFLENFTDTELGKDPGIIASYLSKSHNVTLIGRKITPNATSQFKTKILSKKEMADSKYWLAEKFDAVIMYSWLSLRYTHIITAINAANTKVILKLDSDGNLLYPLVPSYLAAYRKSDGIKNKIIYLARLFQWKVIPKSISKLKIKQIEKCHAIIIESEKAKENLKESLLCFHREELIKKINFIPNPVVINTAESQKENIILCVGRWDDPRKNKQGLIASLSNLKTNWQVIVIGKGSDLLAKKIKLANPGLKITGVEFLKHAELLETTAKSKIFFSSSNSESFGLAAAETLCLGGSVVAGPIPSFIYFAKGGTSGSLALDFDSSSLINALNSDINKWEDGYYKPSEIRQFWQAELNPDKIIGEIIKLINNND